MDKTHFFNLINAGNINSGLLSENFARSQEEFLNFPVNLKGLPILIAADSAVFEFSSKDVFQILINLVKKTKMSAVIATHNSEIASKLDRVIQIKAGKLL